MRTAAVLLVLAACGDDLPTCDLEYGQVPGCYAAQIFASRDTGGIVPTRADLDRYADRWHRATLAEPLLESRIPQTYRNVPPSSLYVLTTNTAAITAWQQQVVATGDPAIDVAVAQLHPSIDPHHYNPGVGVWEFTLHVPITYSEENLAAALAQTGTMMSDPFDGHRDDGTWTWSGETAQIDFDVGFIDCFIGCGAFRHLRAVVPFAGDATVFDLGGDPLPPGYELGPNTLPP